MDERSLEKKEEYSLIADWQNNKNEKSLNRLIGAYHKLIKSVAKKFSSYGLNQSDLIQEGTIGFMHALEKFDLLKGFRLSTYSHWWIRAAIQSYILKNWSVVKSGNTASQKTLFFGLNKLKKQINFNSHGYMGQDELEKISSFLNIKPLEVQYMENRLSMGDQSLNRKIDDEDGSDLLSLLKSDAPSPEDIFQNNNDNNLKNKWIAESIEKLNDREKKIIMSRNLKDSKETLGCIGKKLNISKERVRQIEVSALKKLRKGILEISKQPKDFFIN